MDARILVVDDNGSFSEGVTKLLRAMGTRPFLQTMV